LFPLGENLDERVDDGSVVGRFQLRDHPVTDRVAVLRRHVREQFDDRVHRRVSDDRALVAERARQRLYRRRIVRVSERAGRDSPERLVRIVEKVDKRFERTVGSDRPEGVRGRPPDARLVVEPFGQPRDRPRVGDRSTGVTRPEPDARIRVGERVDDRRQRARLVQPGERVRRRDAELRTLRLQRARELPCGDPLGFRPAVSAGELREELFERRLSNLVERVDGGSANAGVVVARGRPQQTVDRRLIVRFGELAEKLDGAFSNCGGVAVQGVSESFDVPLARVLVQRHQRLRNTRRRLSTGS